MSASPWFEAEQLSEHVVRVSEPSVHRFYRANIYHVKGDDADLVIDFGMGLQSLGRFLDIDATKPILAVATHVHVDHVGSFHEFDNRFGHAAEEGAFSTMPDLATLAHYFRTQPECVSRAPTSAWDAAKFGLNVAPLTNVVTEGSVIDTGSASYRVLHLPGHSPGSIGLLDERNGILFSGDAIYDGALVDDLPGCEIDEYLDTMSRLQELDVSIVYGGHGAPMSRERMHHVAENYQRKMAR
ncbi:Zn-dependent hydrolase, glyoxylase [Rhizobium leguminosarum bv. trifolii WSM597]|uniref:Zn-dependent hydrolase, glyoxylase n=1 Tax=Rhizobium leguminosarum bv. trifolii WSM597 TaxID=754764 RepID=J0H991_RHILT|nr:MBL fold metallo-hydrolase [Rhizobium leguminosarum]EJB06898.1 Zn-dependent hydrolase, glyoxylase [Rhizobium leguminosarum bv. trifolii WSM597]